MSTDLPSYIPELVSEEDIRAKVKEMGKQISDDYRNRAPLRIIGALKGCFVYMADLLRAIDIPTKVDFMEVSSYGDAMQSSGNVKIIKDLTHNIEGEHVLVAEDIIDTGLTLNHVIDMLWTRHPASLAITALLVKPTKQKLKHPIKYSGFEIPDEFVVGYGLDYSGYMRNLPYIGKITDTAQLTLFDDLEKAALERE